MRILVVSDTHGSADNLRRAILAQPKAEIVIHLGDGEQETNLVKAGFPEKMFLQVRGNCDWGSSLPETGDYTVEAENASPCRIFYTHGHLYGVKSGLYTVQCAARERKANVLLFGHTHMSCVDYDDGLYIMNPGTLRGWQASYGTLDVTPQGIVPNLWQLP